MNYSSISTLVVPIAGLGTRMRPLTLKTPKPLLELRGKTLLEYILDETAGTGITRVVFIANPHHREALEKQLLRIGTRYPHLTFTLRFQDEPLGDGDAILKAADIVANEPFAVRFPDDVVVSVPSVLQGMCSRFALRQAPLILLERIAREHLSRYGVADVSGDMDDHGMYQISGLVEKPNLEEAPSDMIIVGGYVLTPEIFAHVQNLARHDLLARQARHTPGVADSLRIIDGLRQYLSQGGVLYGWKFEGKRLDCGTLEGFRTAEEFLAAGRI